MSPSGDDAAGSLPSRPSTPCATTALAAIDAAADLDALAEVRTTHVSGRGAPLSLARRALGALPGPERAEPGKRLNALTSAINEAFERRSAELTAERDARVLVEEAVDVTVPPARVAGRQPPSRFRSWSTAWSMSSSRWVTRWPRARRPSTAGSISTR